MALLTITPEDVAITELTPGPIPVTAGEALTQGEPVYRSTTASDNGRYFLGDADDAAKDDIAGIVLTPAAIAKPAMIAVPGSKLIIGATLTVGQSYYLSQTAGGIELYSDLAGGDVAYVTQLGIAISTTILLFDPIVTGITKP